MDFGIKQECFKAFKPAKKQTNSKPYSTDNMIIERVWQKSGLLNRNSPASYPSKWNRFNKNCDQSNVVYFGSKDEARAHKAFSTPDKIYNHDFIEKVNMCLQRAASLQI